MGHYHIRLDPDAQKICTIAFLWGKYQYLHLPMGINCAPDIFQEQMYKIMSGLDFVKLEWQPEISKEIYIELPIDIEVIGPYHSFGQFVSKIAGLPRIVTLHDFKIKIEEGDEETLNLKLQAKTYRYQEESAR